MPMGQIDGLFTIQQDLLRAYAGAIAAAALESGQRAWLIPYLGGGPLDNPGIAAGFDRSDIADLYAAILTSPQGSSGDAMAMKVQSDYLASQERALHLRHKTNIACVMNAAARRLGHAAPAGSLGRVDGYAQDLILAGDSGYQSGA
jgi:hypothetical protein